MNAIGFQSQMFRKLNSLVQFWKFRVSDMGYKPFAPSQGEAPDFPTDCGSLRLGGVYGKNTSQPYYPPGCGPFLICWCKGAVQLVFRSFFSERIFPYVAVDLVCLWEEVSSVSSYVNTLDNPIYTLLFLHEKEKSNYWLSFETNLNHHKIGLKIIK